LRTLLFESHLLQTIGLGAPGVSVLEDNSTSRFSNLRCNAREMPVHLGMYSVENSLLRYQPKFWRKTPRWIHPQLLILVSYFQAFQYQSRMHPRIHRLCCLFLGPKKKNNCGAPFDLAEVTWPGANIQEFYDRHHICIKYKSAGGWRYRKSLLLRDHLHVVGQDARHVKQ